MTAAPVARRPWLRTVDAPVEPLTHPNGRPVRDPDDLTPRELEVLRLTADGRQNNTIADRLGISPETVKAHQKNLRRKLAARDRAHAVHLGHQRGWL